MDGWMDGWLDGRMAMAEVRESTPDQTPGPSRARWMEGGGTVRLHHQRQLGLLTARGICMRTLRIPSIHVQYTCGCNVRMIASPEIHLPC